MDKAPHLLHFFFFDEVEGIEILDLGRYLAGKIAGVELSDAGHAALASKQPLPHFSGGVSHAADQADAGDYYPASQIYLPPFECLEM